MASDLSPSSLQTLEDARVTLLSSIQEARESQHFAQQDKKTTLNGLVAHYNSVIDQIEIENVNVSSLRDPLEILPTEIWQEMIRSNLPNTDDVFILTLVSKNWQQRLISCPLLWTNIALSEDHYDMEAELVTLLTLSAELPVSISIPASMEVAVVIAPFLVNQAYRIRSMVLTFTNTFPGVLLDWNKFFDVIIDSAGELTSIEDIDFAWGEMAYVERLFSNAGKIRSIRNVQTSPKTFQLSSLQDLQSLTTHQHVRDLVPHIQHLKSLDKLSVGSQVFGPYSDITAISHDDVEEDVPHLARSFGSIRQLSLREHGGGLSWRLVTHVSSTIQDLSLMLSWRALPEFIGVSRHMVGLTSLDLTLPFSRDCEFQHNPTILPEIKVKTFTLDISSYAFSDTWTQEEVTAHQLSANHLGETLVSWLPAVNNFHISSSIGHSFVIQYIQTLKHLTTLHATGSHHEPVTDVKGTLPHVEYMLIWDKSPIFASLTFPNIRHLYLHEALDMWDRIDEPLTFHPGPWSNLVSLDVAGHKVDWCDMSLPSLEKIIVGAYSPNEQKHDNSLITDLASRLDILPSVNHIGFRFIPEFDLLFIMLERRNFGTDIRTTPITTISLPSRLINPILKPLTSRLGKKLTKRPSNLNLSSTSIAEAYFDPSLSGCSFCFLSFHSCNAPLNPCAWGHQVTRDFQPPPYHYPRYSKDVLSTWRERREWWNDTRSHLLRRPPSCNFHNLYSLEEYTAYSYDDLATVTFSDSINLQNCESVFGEEEGP